MSIQVKNWSVFFEKYPVLHNIDLEFNGQGFCRYWTIRLRQNNALKKY